VQNGRGKKYIDRHTPVPLSHTTTLCEDVIPESSQRPHQIYSYSSLQQVLLLSIQAICTAMPATIPNKKKEKENKNKKTKQQ
jgi:hypothetical protein